METPSALISNALRAALSRIGEAEPGVKAVSDPRFGDYQINVAMALGKQLGANPRQVAQQIVEKLDVAGICEPPEIAGPGFINLRLKRDWLLGRFAEFSGDARLGVPEPASALRMVIDFSSPNVAKPMHVGHIRSTFLGDALARIAAFAGHAVVRDNHIGDWGTQFGMLLVGWKTEIDRAALDSDPLAEMERLYKLISARCKEDAVTLKSARNELVALQAGDAGNLAIWREMIQLSQHQFDTIYARLGVTFDVALGESFYNAQLKGIVENLRSAGIARESDGAVCVFSDGLAPPEQDPFLIKDKDGWRPNPAIVQKSDGAANYTTTDLATLEHRIATWHPDQIVYVTDGRQQLHFRQLFAIFKRWRPQVACRLAHVWFGAILGDDGRPFKTRSGETVKLVELLDEAEERAFAMVTSKNPDMEEAERREIARVVGLGAVRYADLLPNRQGDYVFSWDSMLSLHGNTAPYLQYSYVRIRSIFRKLSQEEATRAEVAESIFTLSEPAEFALLKKLYQFGEVLPQVLDDFRPNSLCNYLYDLASAFHSFFEACPVLRAEVDGLRASRLSLCEATARVLKTGLGLLGIEVTEKM